MALRTQGRERQRVFVQSLHGCVRCASSGALAPSLLLMHPS